MMTMKAPEVPKVAPVITPIFGGLWFVEVSDVDDIWVEPLFGRDEVVGWIALVTLWMLVVVIVTVLAGNELEFVVLASAEVDLSVEVDSYAEDVLAGDRVGGSSGRGW
jgi:hypothetical protein